MGEGAILGRTLSRRRFLAASVATAGAAAGLGIAACDPYIVRKIQQEKNGRFLNHSVWVWQFSTDGGMEAISSELQGKNVGVVVKTHDGIDWMSKYDHHPDAVSSGQRAANIGRYFEDRGIPVPRMVRGEGPRSRTRGADVRGSPSRRRTQSRP